MYLLSYVVWAYLYRFKFWPRFNWVTVYIKNRMCACFFVPYERTQFWADLHEIWQVDSQVDGQAGLTSVA